MKTRVLAFVLSSILLTSCAFTPHEIAVTAKAPTTPSSIGKGVTVALEVLDDREDIVVGQRGAGMRGADITVKDIIPALERELRNGLEAKGFTVVSGGTSGSTAGNVDTNLVGNGEPDVDFEAKLRAFKFFIESGFWSGAENTSVVINVEAVKGGQDYEKSYRFNSEESAMVVPEGSEIDDALNAALSEVLAQIMRDQQLMSFLAQ